MKKIIGVVLLSLGLSVNAVAADTCPKIDQIKPGNFMSLTVYRAKDYQSKWFYEPNLIIKRFIKAEADSEQLQECWYEANDPRTNKTTILTLSPVIKVSPKLEDTHWQKGQLDYYHCEGNAVESCPLKDSKGFK